MRLLAALIGVLATNALAASIYELLNLPSDATPEEVSRAYRRRALGLHPDKNKDPNAVEEFKELSNAHAKWNDGREASQPSQSRPSERSQPAAEAEPVKSKRDVASIAAYAIIDGIVGVASTQLLVYKDITYAPAQGLCKWEGTSPACLNNACAAGFDSIRKVTLNSGEDGFGTSCIWPGEKTYCCREDSANKAWAGRWVRSTTGEVIRCVYRKDVNITCAGAMKCLTSKRSPKFFEIEIVGDDCDEVLFNETHPRYGYSRRMHGRAVPGMIQLEWDQTLWFEKDIDRFYKVN